MGSQKKWLSYRDQIKLLESRGLEIENPDQGAQFLAQVNYYRLSGYFRYWQEDPAQGNNAFIMGSSLTRIQNLYQREEELKAICLSLLHKLEVLIRARFAYHYAEIIGPTDKLTRGIGLSQPLASPSKATPPRIEDSILRNLGQSREPFISHYRSSPIPSYLPEDYTELPVWVAVEALSFGVLSKLLIASKDSGVLSALAASLSISQKDITGQVRSFVYLRNRISHCSRIWNHPVLDRPGLQPAQVRRAKKVRDFSDLSIYKILLAMDAMASKAGIRDRWLAEEIEPLLASSKLLEAGIAKPQRYGEMAPALLLG